jgi:hypothetical protein
VSAGRRIIQVARAGARDAVFDVPAQIKDNAPLDPEVTVSLGKAAPTPLKRSADIAVTLGTNPNVTAKGRVREVSPRADPVTVLPRRMVSGGSIRRTRTAKVPVTGRIQLDAVSGITIPATALVRADGRTAVWVFDAKTGTVSLRNIAVRASDATTVQVASGLNPGDVVVTAGVQALRPGQKVRLLESQS